MEGPGKVFKYYRRGTTTIPREIALEKYDQPNQNKKNLKLQYIFISLNLWNLLTLFLQADSKSRTFDSSSKFTGKEFNIFKIRMDILLLGCYTRFSCSKIK